MTTGASPKGRRSAPPKLAPLRALTGPEAFFRSAQDGDCRATVARRATGTGGPRDECLDRQVKRVARRVLAGAATALKERERDDRVVCKIAGIAGALAAQATQFAALF